MSSIPSHWGKKKLKYVASLKSGDTITSDSITESGEYPVFGENGIRGYTSAYTHCGKYVLIGRHGALCGNINYASGCFWASEHAVVVDIKGEDEVAWLGELLRSMDLNQYSQSAAQPGIAVDVIANLEIPVPPLHEQCAIADYLDRETARLDGLVAAKERVLGLLAEKRRALITRNTEILGSCQFGVPPLTEQSGIVAHVAAGTAKLDALRAATERTIALLKERRTALIAAPVTGRLDVQGVERDFDVAADDEHQVRRPR